MKAPAKPRSTAPATSRSKTPGSARSAKNPESAADRHDRPRCEYEIRSVTNALELLEAISVDQDNEAHGRSDEVRITQLSQRLGLSKSAVYRLLVTFEMRGYVERISETGAYRIGVNAYETGRRLLLRMGVLRHARPVMEDLCRHCNEAVYLAIRRGGEFLFIDLTESAQQVKIASLVGKRFPLEGAAPGQVLLAYAKGNAGQPAGLADAGIRSKGYQYEQGGLGEMVGCLAAPFFDSNGAVSGALCIIGPSFRLPAPQAEAKLWPLLKEASEAVSSKLGYLRPFLRLSSYEPQ